MLCYLFRFDSYQVILNVIIHRTRFSSEGFCFKDFEVNVKSMNLLNVKGSFFVFIFGFLQLSYVLFQFRIMRVMVEMWSVSLEHSINLLKICCCMFLRSTGVEINSVYNSTNIRKSIDNFFVFRFCRMLKTTVFWKLNLLSMRQLFE